MALVHDSTWYFTTYFTTLIIISSITPGKTFARWHLALAITS